MTAAPFPFIVGCGRSGTTLLRGMLASHPDMWVPPESYWIERILGVRDRLDATTPFDSAAFLTELREDTRFQAWGCPVDAVADTFARRPPTDTADAVRAVFATYAAQEGRVRWADKTPIYVLVMDRIAGLLPEARFVHLIRDGRDVASSYLRLPWGPRSFTTAVTRWRRHVGAGRRFGRALGPDRYLEVRYEALVADPETEIRRLCTFIQLDFDPAMLDPAAASERILRATSHTEFVAGVRDPIDAQRRSWQATMSARQSAWFEALAGSLRSELGYPAGAPASLGEQVAGTAATRAAGGMQWGIETLKRSRVAMQVRPTVRAIKGRLGFSLG